VFKKGSYCFSSNIEVLTDVGEFDARYENGCRLEKARRMEEAAAEYKEAIELYRDDYLVEDLYEDWTMVERERLSNAYMDMLSRLACYYLECRQPQESIRTSYKLLKKDPCHEDSYRLMMECFLHLGLRSRALNQYQLCRHMLRREHDMEPSLELRAFCDSIKK
jgi:two-component SAPR family response regulator